MRKGHRPADEQNQVHLVPTKAALFGLDVRFRVIEEKMLQDKLKRSSFNVSKGKKGYEVGNRHTHPSQDKIQSLRKVVDKQYDFKAGTCFDDVVTNQLNSKLPAKISYLVKPMQAKLDEKN
jgi:hypothetical protein